MLLRPSELNKWLNPGKAVWSLKTLAGRCRDLLVLQLTKTSLVYPSFMKTAIYQSGVACFFLRPLPALFVQGQFKILPPKFFILWINISSLQSLFSITVLNWALVWCHQPVLKKEPYEIKFWSPIRLLLRTLIINYIIHWPLYKASQEKFFSVLILGITLLCMSNWFVFVFWILQMMKLSFFFWLPAKNLRARSVVGSPRVKE